MKYSIRSTGTGHILEVTEDETVCTLTLERSHDILTKGEDPKGLAPKISRSYRNCVGKGYIGKDFLKIIKSDLVKRSAIKSKESD